MRVLLRTLKLYFVSALLAVALGTASVIWIFEQIPSKSEIKGCLTTVLYKVHLCPSDPHYTPLRKISPFVQKSVIISEDGSFYAHHGFDLEELKRSLKRDLAERRFARGGSTLTQQLAKNLFLTSEKSITRKVREALITLRLEQVLSKHEILEKYLNVVQWGPGIFGIQRAAEFYFHKSPADLNLVESAFLAMLLPSPVKYSRPFLKNQLTPFAQKRIREIIENLNRYGRITSEQFGLAESELEVFNPKVDSSAEPYTSESELEEESEDN